MGPAARSDHDWRQLLADQIRQHARLWFRLAHDILRDAHVAEDVCQQALMKAWTHRDQLRDASLLRAWLARTVVNESLALLRRKRTERRVFDHVSMTEERSAMPDETLSNREAAVAALDQLAEPVRVVVALRIMEGLSGNEVKELLGCSAAQVSRLLHEGLEQLRSATNAPGATEAIP